MNTKIKLTVKLFLVGLLTLSSFLSMAQPAKAASNITCNSATISGWVDPQGVTTTAWLVWGETTSYGNQTPPRDYTTYQSFSENITGLRENTTYHYQARFQNPSRGYWTGSDSTFTTPACQPTSFTVTTSAGPGGSISPTSQIVNAGNTTSFTVIPNSGYTIASVTGCGGNLSGNVYTTGTINSNCTVYASFNYVPQNPSVQLTANPTQIQSGQASTLSWTSQNTTSCFGSNFNTNNNVVGNQTVYPTNTTTYTITCTNSTGQQATANATVTVNQVQTPTVTIYANPNSINYNGTSLINWNSSNATSCTGTNGTNGWAGSLGAAGSFYTGNLNNTTTYSITCTSSTGQQGFGSTTVVVGGGQGGNQATVSISADKTNLSYNEGTTIRWYPNNASYCYASGGNNNWPGTRSNYSDSFYTGTLNYTTTYTITCTGSTGGSDSKSVTIYVNNNNNNNNQINYTTPTATTTPATLITNTTAQLNGLILNNNTNNYNNNVDAAYSYFEWGPTVGLGNKTPTTYIGTLPAARHASTVRGLQPGTLYYFRVVAENSAGRSTGSTLSFVTTSGGNNGPLTIQIPDTVTTIVRNTTSSNTQSLILLTIDGGQDKISNGEKRTYFINWQNKSNQLLRNVVLRVVLPAGMTYESSTRGSFSDKDNTVTLDIGALNPQEAGNLSMVASVNSDIKANEVLVVVADMVYTDQKNVQADAIAYATHHLDQSSFLGANAFWSGAFLPSTLLGWILLIILILLLILLGRHVYNQVKTPKQLPAPTPPLK